MIRFLSALLLLSASFLLACGPPVAVRRVSPQDVYARDSASILDTGQPSRFTEIVLQKAALRESFEENPQIAIRALHYQAVKDRDPEELLALAELSFLQGRESSDRKDYLGAAVYAYLFLFGPQAAPATEWDPRTRIAADVYNRSLPRAFESTASGEFEVAGGRRELPIGSIDIRVARTTVEWPGSVSFARFLPADEFEVEGLPSRYRRAGLGAPLIAERTTGERGEHDPLPARLSIPATAFLRVEGGIPQLAAGEATADLELHDPVTEHTIEVRGRRVPLEAQTTTAYAYLLGDSPVWDFELQGFLGGDSHTIDPGISMLEPYQKGRIPVVLVHGTASSPGRWAVLFNELRNDPSLGERFQFWFFTYRSGNPIGFSAGQLRSSLTDLVARLDPRGIDPALREMVLVGHSQGGLLVRLAISDTTQFDLKDLGVRLPGKGELAPDELAAMKELFIFEPQPGVTRVIFLATPHRGSFVAGGVLGRGGARFISFSQAVISLPWNAVAVPVMAVASGENPLQSKPFQLTTAVENMAPDSRFVKTIERVPMDQKVPKHSIVAVRGDGPAARGNDGVVEYESAHLDGVESEVVIRSGHSLQSDPYTVAEIKRILREHLESVAGND